MGSNSISGVSSPVAYVRDETGAHWGLISASANGAAVVWRDILVCLWSHRPTFVETDQLCDALERMVRQAEAPGFWLVADATCAIPSVSVRRLMAARLRRLKSLRLFAVSVEAPDAKGVLMRATMRSTAVAGGIRTGHFGVDVPSVATHIATVYPGLSYSWGERVLRVLRSASAEAAAGEASSVHHIANPPQVEPDL